VLREIDIGGIYLAPIVPIAVVAGLLFAVLRALLARAGVMRLAWHPALFEFALLLCIVSLLVLLT